MHKAEPYATKAYGWQVGHQKLTRPSAACFCERTGVAQRRQGKPSRP